MQGSRTRVRQKQRIFSFSCSFLVENATKTLRETPFLKLTRKLPQRIGPRLRRTLFISMTGVLSNGKNRISPLQRPRRLRPKPVDARLNGRPSGKKNSRIHEAHAQRNTGFR